MARYLCSSVSQSQRKPIAACIASLFALSAPTTTLAALVTNCLDDGSPGTLRSAIAATAEAGTVTFTGLACSTVTLAGSPISISQNSLIIDGGTAPSRVTVDAASLARGYYSNRVLTHTGTGTLTIDNLTLKNGFVYHYSIPSYGGCLSSNGSVVLNSSTVTKCSNTAKGFYTAVGGAIDVAGDLTLHGSTVSYSTATGTGALSGALGGGIYAKGTVSVQYGYIYSNSATSTSAGAKGGGIYGGGVVSVKYSSLIFMNTASGASSGRGGGIYAKGNVDDFYPGVVVSNNYATASAGGAYGGGIFVGGGLAMTGAQIKYNVATGSTGAQGAGVLVNGDTDLEYSSVSHNALTGGGNGNGSGLHAAGSVTISASTVANNTATGCCAGVDAFTGSPAGNTFLLRNSTISSNSAAEGVGGVYANSGTQQWYNSTIAFNNATTAVGGAAISTLLGPVSAVLQSTLMSNNYYGSGGQNDFAMFGSVSFDAGSSDNLVRATSVTIPGTANNVCPLLGPLRDNGGRTPTHQLLSHSPLIDSGNNVGNFSYDQRGSASNNGTSVSYPRVLGPVGQLNPHADIGAYEYDQADIVFNAGFDGCKLLL